MVPKFRAWNGYRKIMADYISAIQNGETLGTPSSVNVIVNGKNETWDIENDHVELLQYTGLKDTNCDDIYENDLVLLYPDDQPYQVIFNVGKFELSNDYLGLVYDLGEEYMDCEIIGNIHEDQDLLEADNE